MNKLERFKEFLKKNGYENTVGEKNGKIEVGGSLDLRGTKITELPENLTVGGYLDLEGTEITELPQNLTVGGYLDLRGTEITELPENLTVGRSLDLRGTKITELPENLTVGGSLDLRGTKITELPENLTVGGYLDLGGTEITELPENLTVGGNLCLEGTKITELPENLTVGGNLDLEGTEITNKQKELEKIQRLHTGYNKEKRYIYFDGILWGNVKSVKKRENVTIYKTPLGYCVTEGGSAAHGKTLKEAMEDLTFKKLKNTDEREIIREIKETGKVSRLQYRAITGACRLGTEAFCQRNHIQDLEEIGLDELKKLLKPADYGAERFLSLLNEE